MCNSSDFIIILRDKPANFAQITICGNAPANNKKKKQLIERKEYSIFPKWERPRNIRRNSV